MRRGRLETVWLLLPTGWIPVSVELERHDDALDQLTRRMAAGGPEWVVDGDGHPMLVNWSAVAALRPSD